MRRNGSDSRVINSQTDGDSVSSDRTYRTPYSPGHHRHAGIPLPAALYYNAVFAYDGRGNRQNPSADGKGTADDWLPRASTSVADTRQRIVKN